MKTRMINVNTHAVNLQAETTEISNLKIRRTAMKNTKFGLGAIVCTLLFLAAAVGPARAQNPPPGAIFDLATTNQHTGVLSNYQQFTTTFTADSTLTYVSFAFREKPAFFALDNTSVTDNAGGGELLNDPGFETATLGQNIPNGWGRWIQPVDQSWVGVVAGAGGSSCDPNGPFGGTGQFDCDGSVEGYDAIWQAINTLPNHKYTVTFELGDNSNQVPYDPGIDMLVYAGDSLPDGTENLPEPNSLLLFGSGVLGIGGLLRKRLLG